LFPLLFNFVLKISVMKIAITSQNRKKITGHAGRCRNFWIFEIEEGSICDRQLLELPKEQSFHDSHGLSTHPLDDVDVLLTAGMGTGLSKRLQRKGIKAVITTQTEDIEEGVKLFLQGNLKAEEPHSHIHWEGHHDHHHGDDH